MSVAQGNAWPLFPVLFKPSNLKADDKRPSQRLRGRNSLSPKVSTKTPALAAGIIVVLAVVLANAAVSYRATTMLARNSQLVVHTLRVIDELETTLSLMKDAETSYRGYVLTNNPAYLDPYDHAEAEVPGHVDKIAETTNGNPNLHRRIPALRRLTWEKLEFTKSVVELQKNGNRQAAVAAVKPISAKKKWTNSGN